VKSQFKKNRESTIQFYFKSVKNKRFFFLLMGFFILINCNNNSTRKTSSVKTLLEQEQKTSFEKTQRMAMDIEGMVCAVGCAAVIEKNLNKTAGIKEAKVDFETKKAILIFDTDVLTPNEVAQVVRNTGEAYTVTDFKLLD
jgi:mercuric ion binding protein